MSTTYYSIDVPNLVPSFKREKKVFVIKITVRLIIIR
ncbi:uncharacterized protein OCT59_009538 [Rhizophagus irregularis]|nr:hypothetical protein OCT59_009538 [Rhizophagus irregularis]